MWIEIKGKRYNFRMVQEYNPIILASGCSLRIQSGRWQPEIKYSSEEELKKDIERIDWILGVEFVGDPDMAPRLNRKVYMR